MNAKQELIEHIGDRAVRYVHISRGQRWQGNETVFSGALSNVQPLLDVEYNTGYGGQELFGNIWYEDGTWSERGEYDGSEWWEHKVCPAIPKGLT